MTIYSHHFIIGKISPVGRMLCNKFASRYVQYGLVPGGGMMHRQALKVFAAANGDRTEYRFHINQLSDWYKLLLQYGYDNPTLYKTIKPGIKPTVNTQYVVDSKWKPRDYQIPIIEYLSKPLPVCKLVGLATGRGKANSLDTKIKVPGGWSTMGEMYVGKKIIAKDGSVAEVTGVFPQGKKQMYRVTFSDERSVECCAEHLWKVYHIGASKHKRWRVVDTLELIRLMNIVNPRIYVDLIDNEDTPDVDLPIDPYVLGVILGDGSIANKSINISKNDQEIFDEINKVLPDDLSLNKRASEPSRCLTYGISRTNPGIRNSYVEALEKMGLMGTLSHEKFIPEIYLNSSYKQRLALIQGLLDTDGYCSTDHSIEYSSSSERLAKDFQYLIRSIGGVARITSKIPHYTIEDRKVYCRTSYRMKVRVKKPSDMFRLKRKKDRTFDDNQYSKILKLRVTSVVKTEIKDAQCISISHPERLYVVNDFIVTHNTASALMAIEKIQKMPCIIVKPAYIEKWTEDLIKTYNLKLEDIMVIQGGKHLTAFLTKVAEGSLEYKAIIISNRTLQIWLTLYEKHKEDTLEMGYVIHPHEFFEHANCGVRLIDEVHQDFHFNFKLDLYTNVEYAISLSATLITTDPFLRTMHDIAYPIKDRCPSPPILKYIHSYAVHYRFSKPDKIRTSEYGSKNYSHGAVEKSILKHVPTTNAYLDLINYVLCIGYMKSKKEGKRCIIFAYSVDMCTKISDYLKKMYPDYIVNRYVSEDDYSNLMQSDIIVSTLGSAGTAVDIPDLTNVILTTAIDSIQSNVQSLGRLRMLDNGDTATEFHYFVCDDIPKHLEYHSRKKIMLAERAKTFIDVYSGYVI